MKKIVLIASALLMVLSGVAAVSAYEAHTINVTAHVENAMTVNTAAIEFGTRFPEEWATEHRTVRLSDSAQAAIGVPTEDPPAPAPAGSLQSVDVTVYAEWKLIPAGTTPYPVPVVQDTSGATPVDYYAWLGECLYVAFGPQNIDVPGFLAAGGAVVGPAPVGGPPGAKATGLSQNFDGVTIVELYVGLDTPVFHDAVNPITDMLQPDGTYILKPSGLDHPTWEIPHDDIRDLLGGVDMGVDLKIQVTAINRN